MEGSIAVRKGAWTKEEDTLGAWTKEEDTLLRQYIEKHGEGKWNQVPSNAGLNRCRKSCRMRWLNYLKPNIKRGGFAADEVDLMIKLHELLGNRWSLIAGRLPGRTANDVKNYWHTYLRKREIPRMKDAQEKAPNVGKVNLIKPQPRTVPKNWTWSSGKFTNARDFEQENDINNTPPTLMLEESNIKWWESLLDHREDDEGVICTLGTLNDESNEVLSAERILLETEVGNSFYEYGLNFMAESSFDASLWDLLDAK